MISGAPNSRASGRPQGYSHSMDALVNVDGVFSCHHLVDGGPALLLLAALLCGSHPAGPGLERNTLFLKDFFGTDHFEVFIVFLPILLLLFALVLWT